MNREPIYIGERHDVRWTGAETTELPLNSATVTWSLMDLDGEEIGSGTLDYLGGTDGDYLGGVPASVTETLTYRASYALEVLLEQGSLRGRRVIYLTAMDRGKF